MCIFNVDNLCYKTFRKRSTVPYIYHPLNLACHALSMDIVEDDTKELVRLLTCEETYFPTLLGIVKATPEYNSAAWLLKYQMESMLDIYKRLT